VLQSFGFSFEIEIPSQWARRQLVHVKRLARSVEKRRTWLTVLDHEVGCKFRLDGRHAITVQSRLITGPPYGRLGTFTSMAAEPGSASPTCGTAPSPPTGLG